MRILGIDTTTKFFCLGIQDNTNIYAYRLELFKKQAGLVIPTIKRVFEVLGLEPKDIDYFACGLGPGSFTGIRIGLSTIKALSFSLNRPIVGFSTLDILAVQVKREGYLVPVIDARRNSVFTAIYKNSQNKLTRTTAYKLISRNEFYKLVPKEAYIFGDALELYREEMKRNMPTAKFLDSDFWYPQPSGIIKLAQEKIKKRELFDSFSLKPIYLYPKECQIKR
ncbi:MAG: tRNA (adenosine(37)-N6)-threonylcarbamoyltransferase complex dimerization subunit type 1 TsaB [Candidatus Omnitrophica bacterium]|nr:tRNA (adenosine(37)-N6)-threonylcarbamoyltransferase complex dimerization subunit type 1 TsaB [Candidatus Omnitrophota bacterium]